MWPATWLTHWLHWCRREELYSDADSFKPERFLHPEMDTKDSDIYHFVPFLYGPRQCLGYRFAPVEMRAVLALLLREFQFDIDANGPAVYKRRLALTMRPDPPLQLRVSLVNPHWQRWTFAVVVLRPFSVPFLMLLNCFFVTWLTLLMAYDSQWSLGQDGLSMEILSKFSVILVLVEVCSLLRALLL